jgi:drug/metabolite transporter (DMT)-like permease
MIGFVLVALLWGTTNAFMKHSSNKIPLICLNLMGSVLFHYLLKDGELSISALVNTLTFMVTALTEKIWFHEDSDLFRIVLGSIFISSGVYVCSSS